MEEQMTLQEMQEVLTEVRKELQSLKQQNEEKQVLLHELMKVTNALILQQENFLKDYSATKENAATSLRIQDSGLTNLKYEIADPMMKDDSFYYPNILPIETTIHEIIQNGCSLARFGDGEFSLMAGRQKQKFQEMNAELQRRLIEVFSSHDERVLIAIADNYGNLEKYSRAGKSGIRTYMTREIRLEHKQFLDLDRYYHNAYISRPCVLYADCETNVPGLRFDALRCIWEHRDVIMIEGAETRLGVGNDLFDNAKSIGRIEGPAENSFAAYPEILQAALTYAQKDTLFLLALGPAASVLAYDLAMKGYQAIDIGHLDLEYEWYLRGGKRCEVKTKYNNEFPGGERVCVIDDPKFESQILERI